MNQNALKTGSIRQEVAEYLKSVTLLFPVLLYGFFTHGFSFQSSLIAATIVAGIMTVFGLLAIAAIACEFPKSGTDETVCYPQ